MQRVRFEENGIRRKHGRRRFKITLKTQRNEICKCKKAKNVHSVTISENILFLTLLLHI